MNLIFEETKNRHQCGNKIVVKGFQVQCTNSTTRIVTIPTGLHYFDGKLNFSQSKLTSTIFICKTHEMQLKSEFLELSVKKPDASIFKSSDSPFDQADGIY
jgi:hypothetical protein